MARVEEQTSTNRHAVEQLQANRMERTTDTCTHSCAARVVGDINLRSFVFYVIAETHPTSTTLTMAVRWTHIQTDNLSSSYKAKHARVANYCVQLPLLIWYHNLLVEVVE